VLARALERPEPGCAGGVGFCRRHTKRDAPPDIVLAHDYLVQVGGAEHVVAEWAADEFAVDVARDRGYKRRATRLAAARTAKLPISSWAPVRSRSRPPNTASSGWVA